jgi:Na+/H+-dicarboxylate symporter
MALQSPVYDVVETPSAAGISKHESPPPSRRSKFLAAFLGVPGILAGAVIGVLLGWALQSSTPSAVLVSWIGIPGDLFIRAIKCLVTPLVFSSLVVGMADMLSVGKAGRIGWRTGLCYLFTTVVASCEGLVWVLIFRNWFGRDTKEETTTVPEFALACDQPGYYLSQVNDTVACVFDQTYNETATSFSPASVFQVTDIHKSFAAASSGFTKRSLSEALQGQLFTIVPSNITLAFSEGTLLSIITFAIPFGVAISLLPRHSDNVASFFREINDVFMSMIKWVIVCTPIAIISLLAAAIGPQEDMAVLVSDVGLYVLCSLCSLSFHALVFYPIWLKVFVRHENPYVWLSKMYRALIFAFGSASSMATLPVVMDCMDATRQITTTLSRFVLSLGATIGMDGGALVYPIAIVFMAETEGIGNIVGSVEYFLIIIVSTIGSVGAGPVPASGIVMTMTIWASVFPSVKLPSTFAYIVATDWFLDRFQTVANVTCDTVVTRIVAELVGETIDADERESLASAVDQLADRNSELKETLSVGPQTRSEV